MKSETLIVCILTDLMNSSESTSDSNHPYSNPDIIYVHNLQWMKWPINVTLFVRTLIQDTLKVEIDLIF